MKKQFLPMAFALLVVMLLIPITSFAKTFQGTINIEVGESFHVDVGFANSTVSSYWSKSNSTFGFASKGTKSCTIYGINVGTGTLTWFGVVNADDFEYYWTVNVTSPNSGSDPGSGPGPAPNNDDNWLTTGSYTADWYDRSKTEFTLSTNQELAGFAYLVNNGTENFNGMTIKLSKDIDLSGKSWVPIGTGENNSFRGTFDGQGYSISGVSIDAKSQIDEQQYYGFFGDATSSVIKNFNIDGEINLVNPVVKKTIYIGGLAGCINGTVDHVTCNMDISYDDNINVSGGNKTDLLIGGLVGYAHGAIKYSKHYGSFYCNQSNADHNNGKDQASPYIGGLVGKSDGIDIEYSENNSPRIKLYMPTIIYGGWSSSYISIGGIIGSIDMSTDNRSPEANISYCRSLMMIDYTDGGLWNGSSGHSMTYLGGIVGNNHDSSCTTNVNMCYSVVPSVTTSKTGWIERTYWGGIGCFIDGYSYCYSNSDVSINVANRYTNKCYDGSQTFTSEEMKTPAFLEEMNKNSIHELGEAVWARDEKGYPYIAKLYSVATTPAGEWTAPEAPESPAQDIEYVADGQTAYYLYNVGIGQFVTGANSWATQISLGTGGQPYMALVVEPMSVSDEAVYLGAVKLKVHGSYTFYGTNGRENGFSIGNTYLFRDSETSGFIDRNQQPVWYWNFEKTANGNYYWHSAYGMGSFDAKNQYARGTWAGQPVVFSARSSADNIEWQFVPVASYDADAWATYSAEKTLYAVRLALYNKLLEAESYGVDTSALGLVYNNGDATVEELQSALEALTKDVARAALMALIPQSSEDNPLDITQYTIENPDFENGQSPWTITEGMGQNLQVQSATYTNGDVKIQNFIEAWYPIEVGSLKDGVICQTVTGLPEGRYRIEADVMARRQENGFPKADQQGIYLFYNNGEYTIHSESLSTGDGAPEHFTFDFDYAGAEQMTIGLMAESTNCNWMGMDNFRLYAIGQMQNDPARQALEDAVANAETLSAQIGDNDITDTDGTPLNASAATKGGFIAALAAAKKALEDGSGYQNALDALAAATDALNTSATVYVEYQVIWQDATEKQEWLTEKGQWSALTGQIATFANNIKEGFNSGTLDGADLANMENAVDNMVSQYIATEGAVQPGNDLTIIIKNADFSEGGGRDLTGTSVPGWNIVRGSITELSADYHDIEAYHRTFDFQQILAYDLPAGTYRITVQGFVRLDEGKNSMVLYAGASERQFKLITDENSDTQICTDGTGSTLWPYDVENPALGGYMPNSMQGAMMYFETVNPATELPYYLNDVTIAHTGGPLTIGVKCDDAGLWILWDNFTLEYVNDNPLTPIFDDIDALAEQLTAMLDEYTTIPNELNEAYTAVMVRVNNKENITSMEDANALIDDIKAVIQLVGKMGPFVRITGSDDAKILTFYYGLPTEDGLELEEKTIFDGSWLVHILPWSDVVENIQSVVFDHSFADYKPTSTYDWFSGMSNLTSIEGIEYVNTSNVTNMGDMFEGCSSLTNLDVSNFNTSNVTSMSRMFSNCSSLTSLDVSNFNTKNVTDMESMFSWCSSLTTIFVGDSWNTADVQNGDYMFYGCTNLVGGKGTAYNASYTDVTYAHIDGGADNPGYFTAKGASEGLLGDANCDGSVDVVDVTTVVDFILGKAQPTAEQFFNADVNRDNSVDVVDLTSIVSIILGTYNYDDTAAGVKALTSSDVLVMDNVKCTMDNGVADIALVNSRDYVAFQMDVTLADGAVLNGVRLSERAAGHSVTYSRIADNTYRIVAYSLSGTPFSGVSGSLLTLDIEGIGQFTIDNALFSDGQQGYTLSIDAATGIVGMENGPMTNDELQMTNAGAMYDLSGKRVGHSTSDIRHSSRKGLFIVNGKTVLVK